MVYEYELYKDYISNFLDNQFIPNCLIILFGCILTYKTYNPLATIIYMFVLYLIYYFIHIELHRIPKIINVHMNCHHNYEDNKNNINRICNLSLEFILESSIVALFYFLQKIFNIIFYEIFNTTFTPEILTFYYGIIYVSIHVINYSIFHTANEHVLHHDTTDDNTVKTCNYGPDLMDKIFETNYSNKFENYNHIIPNIMMSFLITYYFYKPTLF